MFHLYYSMQIYEFVANLFILGVSLALIAGALFLFYVTSSELLLTKKRGNNEKRKTNGA